jgi:hypothetical protein
VSNVYWKDRSNQFEALKDLEHKLGIKDRLEWYTKTNKDVITTGGSALLYQFQGSLGRMLLAFYPDISWDEKRFTDFNGVVDIGADFQE